LILTGVLIVYYSFDAFWAIGGSDNLVTTVIGFAPF
jgi:hypothetical protein